MALAGDFITGLIDTTVTDDDALRAIDGFFALWRDRLVDSEFRAGCPSVAVAVETNDGAPQLKRAAAAVFTRWREALAAALVRQGLPERRSARLATFIIAAVEGAVIMCRAEESIAPLEAAADEVHDLLVAAFRE